MKGARLRRSWARLDAIALAIVLTLALWLPVAFLVPYNDEWLRINYLADHSVWQWTVDHARSWVVRPTAELILGVLALPNVRPAMPQPFSASVFMARYHAMYGCAIVALFLLLFANAAALAGSWRAFGPLSVVLALLAVCMLLSGELGYAFYWTDGYANIVLPFGLLTLGMLLVSYGRVASVVGVISILLGACGHEVPCIFALGFSALTLLARRPKRARWFQFGAHVVSLAGCGVILAAQLFSEGPSARSEAYFARTGVHYNIPGMWEAIRYIDLPRSLLAYAFTLAIVAVCRDRLSFAVTRAAADFREHRSYWLLLAGGALLTSLLPMASVGLKKPLAKIAATGGGYYLVDTELFVILGALLSYPCLAPALARVAGPYRAFVRSVLPLVFVSAFASNNLAPYASVLRERAKLVTAASTYMAALAATPVGQAVSVCRPDHPFVKPRSTMTTRNAAQYFGLRKVSEPKCPP